MPIFFWFPCLASLGIAFMLLNIPPVATHFMDMFGIGYAGLAFFLSAVFWTHSLVQVPAGIIVDRLGTIRSLVISASLCIAGGLLPLLMPHSLVLAVAMRMLVGFATGMLFLVAVKISKYLCPPQHLARGQAWQGAAFSLGTMLPYLLLPPFGSLGWVAAYGIGAFFPALMLLAIFWLPRADLKTTPSAEGSAKLWAQLKVIARSPHLWFLGCCHGFSFGSVAIIGSWLPSILADSKAGSVSADWSLFISGILLVGAVARTFSGDIIRFKPRQELLPYLVFGVGLLYALLAFAPNYIVILILGLLLSYCCCSTYASVFTLAMEVFSPAQVATAVGFMTMIANFVNVILTILFGNIREYTGSFSIALLLGGLAAIAVALWGRKLSWKKIVK